MHDIKITQSIQTLSIVHYHNFINQLRYFRIEIKIDRNITQIIMLSWINASRRYHDRYRNS